MATDTRHPLTGRHRTGAPTARHLGGAAGTPDDRPRLGAHACWYPAADPAAEQVAFICDRGGWPQLWTAPVGGSEARLLDAASDHVTEVSWSPDGRWIAYTVSPGGSGHTRVLCVRPDGSDRRILAGAAPGSSAYLGCWTRDGTALAVTIAEPTPGHPAPHEHTERPAGWTERDGHAALLHDGGPEDLAPPARDRLSAYLVDPAAVSAPVFLAEETEAATLRVCDISQDGGLALLRRGPRGRREAVVVRPADPTPLRVLGVADGDPWIGRFSPDARTVWLRSDHQREFAALLALDLDGPGDPARDVRVLAQRADCDLELLAFVEHGRRAALAWNVLGTSALETLPLTDGETAPYEGAEDTGEAEESGTAVPRAVELEHEVVTRVAPAGPDGMLVALSGSQRRPGVWHLPGAALPAPAPWTARDADTVPPGPAPVRPVPLRPTARDGLLLGGWYRRAPGHADGEPAPCVIHLHGGPEEQERPVFDPLYHELLGRGLDVFAPDVRGSSGWGRTFRDADLGEGRFAAIQDVADCAAYVIESGLADPRRLAVMGHSYGGYLTLASLVWHPELFRTGVTVCGMSDFATFFAGTEPWLADSAAHKYGHPERDQALLRALSPMSRVDALRVPLLAIHGEHDTNVPPLESEQIVAAARNLGLEAELLLLHEEGHDFRRAESRRLFRLTAADWIQRRLPPV
ncbi:MULTISPECIES: alpha/beta fold hydrolase [unclassified Streptomyces]|uniref:alpha/beta fold hydrolase n=1 Tax=unclassified Streptomyces TaxID=2593676 RepID=UPI0016602EEF|nr:MULTISPECIES: alpha/beta fold hydrolase [unclassified Streptomyces]MBD0711202.1 S9 family peptidase [Streptomyces sp. CBMA291]MBD0714233.1 S9 family peptidase [Streptomyces sp. CBMA370]